jgi:hypothetical protein
MRRYFTSDGQMADQPFHSPIPNGMVRCYVSHNQVVGFGHQYVTALVPGAPDPRPRIYHPETKPEFQSSKTKMETEWLPQLQEIVGIETKSLPIIWDADFLYGPKTADGEDTYVLCDINVSSVYPYPDSAIPRTLLKTLSTGYRVIGSNRAYTRPSKWEAFFWVFYPPGGIYLVSGGMILESHHHPHKERKQLINRLARIEGHVRSIKEMADNGWDCPICSCRWLP